ncbi:MAG: aspartate aminotransferase family protein, partial [Candidatus Omnitrophica bacterium]|nr:aspartate aminotransferase family protein [Candidatus Omnitrophota bacterium]
MRFLKKPKFLSFPFKKKKDKFPKNSLPKVRTKTLPGPQSVKLTENLKRFECPQLTFIGDPFPVFLKKALGANITDVDGNRYLDFTSCFAVSGLGHSAPAVLRAMKAQSKLMIHGMGDVHPNEVKTLLAKRLSEITPGNLNQTIFSSTGSEAVESALKTAVMHTKKTGVVAFTGAYHGLGYGALAVTHREDFRKPFLKQLGNFVTFAPFPDVRVFDNKASEVSLKAVQRILKRSRRSKHPIGAVLLEPIQGRGGIHAAPPEFLKNVRGLCDEEKILLIADEVFTGFGRTGSMFAVDKSMIVPDLLCLGKGMGNGFPISACIGTTRVMYSWGPSTGDAVHTSTFLGNPLGCAVALAVIQEIEDKKLVDRSKNLGDFFRKELWKLKEKYPLISDIRGAGLMIGMEFTEPP